jgi:hypothetical protein
MKTILKNKHYKRHHRKIKLGLVLVFIFLAVSVDVTIQAASSNWQRQIHELFLAVKRLADFFMAFTLSSLLRSNNSNVERR